jgi:hypothetical protein
LNVQQSLRADSPAQVATAPRPLLRSLALIFLYEP